MRTRSLLSRQIYLCCFAAAVLGQSGCTTTSGLVQEPGVGLICPGVITAAREADSSSPRNLVVRLQSPVSNRTDDPPSAQPDVGLPPLPDPNTAVISSEPVLSPLFPNGAGSQGPQSIGGNRLTDQPDVAQPSGSSNRTAIASGRPVDAALGGMNPILRNRLDGGNGEELELSFPDIHSDPGKRYHDRYGVESEYDPFLLPSIVNLIFEDRWLLAEKDPAKALQNQLRRRMKIDIRDPDPDTANFPNGAYTLPKGRLYIENSPLGLYGASQSGNQPRVYQWEYLIRYGLTDNLEFRIFSNGLTAEGGQGAQPAITGYSPLAFDFKANFWEENTKYHIPAMGIEVYLQTSLFGSSALNLGTQPSINLLFDQSLPFGVGFEYNFGITGAQNNLGQIAYQFSYQWSFQREVVKDFDVFVHGFYNAAALPRLSQFQDASRATIPNVTVVGFGGIWTVNNRLSLFGSYNFGVSFDAPTTIALMGFAVAL
jgi:hypothetical protein